MVLFDNFFRQLGIHLLGQAQHNSVCAASVFSPTSRDFTELTDLAAPNGRKGTLILCECQIQWFGAHTSTFRASST
jgi:hypothetical protein